MSALQQTVAKLADNMDILIQKNVPTTSTSAHIQSHVATATELPSVSGQPVLAGASFVEVDLFSNNNNNNVSSINLENARSTYGYTAEALPFVETVHPSVKRNIQEGKDVNLASLLIPYYNCQSDSVPGGNQKPDVRLNTELSLPQFIQAFAVYKNIMCQVHPNRRPELDLYERDIIDMASRYGGRGFYEYHKSFSAQAAAHLRFHGVKIDWSVRNNRLFCSIFSNYKANCCSECGSTLHMSQFCPSQTYAVAGNTMEMYNKASRVTTTAGSFANRANSTKDLLGRTRVIHNGNEICNNFNTMRGCHASQCRHLHLCLVCKQTDHSKMNCQISKNWRGQGQKIPSLR